MASLLDDIDWRSIQNMAGDEALVNSWRPSGGAPQSAQPMMAQQPMAQSAMMAQPQGAPRRRRGLGETIGGIGDVLAAMGGRQGLYGAAMERRAAEEQQAAAKNALGNWLANPEDNEAFMAYARFDPKSAFDFRKAQQGEQFTLGEGQQRFDAQGRPIATGPDKPRKVQVIDGVAFDEQTGEMLYESPYNRIIPGPDGSFFQVPRLGIRSQQRSAPAQETGLSEDDAAPILAEAMRSKLMTPEDYSRIEQSFGPNGRTAAQKWMLNQGIRVGKMIGGKRYEQRGRDWYEVQ